MRGETLHDASSQWARGQGGSSIQDVEALGKAAEPDLIEAIEQAPSLLNGLRNVWCYSGLFGNRLFLIHCVQTEA